jgi:ABC-type Mn2+/Zn2+ transport system ATPase subunit
MKEQKEIETNLRQEKMKKEEEMLMVEKDYQTLQEAVDDMRKLNKTLRIKYKSAIEEIKDLAEEHNDEKEELLETIRTLEKECGLFKSICHNLFNPPDLHKLIVRVNCSNILVFCNF